MRAENRHYVSLQERVATGAYRVDSARVAAAMLERIGALALDRQISERADRSRRATGRARQAA